MARLRTAALVALAAALNLNCGRSESRLPLPIEQVREAWLARSCSVYEPYERDQDLKNLVKQYGSQLAPLFQAALDGGPSEGARAAIRQSAAEEFRDIQSALDRNRESLNEAGWTRLRQIRLEEFVARAERDYTEAWVSAVLAGLALAGESGEAAVRRVLSDERSPYREAARVALAVR